MHKEQTGFVQQLTKTVFAAFIAMMMNRNSTQIHSFLTDEA
jgi:hypothetical protein